jgi:uncharacterized glyoxalase superfamily protein PhnB
MKKAVLELMVDDMERSIQWYTDVLGFKKSMATPEINPVFVSLSNENVDIMLYSRQEFSKEIPKFKEINLGGSFVLYISVENIQSLYNSIKEKAKIIQELHKTDYGSEEFSLEDPNGYVLMFGEIE